MNVYSVVFEVDAFQSLLASDVRVHEKKLLALDGESKKENWGESLAAEIDNSLAATPDIFTLGAGNMLIYGKSFDLLFEYLGSEYELLPVHWENNTGYCINQLRLSDCIDGNKSVWCVDDDSGKKLFIEEHVFNLETIPASIMFKDTLEPYEIFTTDREGSLKEIVEKRQLDGISFELLWSS